MIKTPDETLRALGMALLMGQIPCDFAPYTDAKKTKRKEGLNYDLWTSVTNDKYANSKTYPTNGGTTCGFVCHWLLWALGCRDPWTVNRNDSLWNALFPLQQSHWMSYLTTSAGGANITRLRTDYGYASDQWSTGVAPTTAYKANATTPKAAFKVWTASGKPTPALGDMARIARKSKKLDAKGNVVLDGNGNTTYVYLEHVYVFLSEVYKDASGTWRLRGVDTEPEGNNPSGELYWLVAEGGQVGGSSMKFTVRALAREDYSDEEYKTAQKKWVDKGDVRSSGTARRLDGWLKLTALPPGRWIWRSPSADPNIYDANAYPIIDPMVLGASRGVAAFTYDNIDDIDAQKLAYRLTVSVVGSLLSGWPYLEQDDAAETLRYLIETEIIDPIVEFLKPKASSSHPMVGAVSDAAPSSEGLLQSAPAAAVLRSLRAAAQAREPEVHPELEMTLELPEPEEA